MADCSGVLHVATGGDDTWNYFNLFYTSGFPHNGVGTSPVYGIHQSGNYVPKLSQYQNGTGVYVDEGICPSSIPLGETDFDESIFDSGLFTTPSGLFGILETNSKHSCLQDVTECGGELWCNKLFFPRRSYKASSTYVSPGYLTEPEYSFSPINGDGTLIAPFAATTVCQANLERVRDRRYVGWDGSIDPYENPDYIEREIKQKFIDVCDEKMLTEVYPYAVGIDDSKISVRDYLPLIGVVHPGWRSTVASKSCVILSTGCGQHFSLPTHTDQSIRVGLFSPKTWSVNRFDAMGYYLDKAGDGRFASSGVGYTGVYTLQAPSGDPTLPLEKVGASGGDDCLFNPFKILVDVECSTNRVKRLNTPTDEPTSLSFISSMPGAACGALRTNPPCSCAQTDCSQNYPPFRSAGEPVYEVNSEWEIVDVEYDGYPGCNPLTGNEKGLIESRPNFGTTIVLGRCVEVAATGGVWLDGSINIISESGTLASGCPPGGSGLTHGTPIPTETLVYLPNGGTAGSGCAIDKTYVYQVNQTYNTAMWDCNNHLYVYYDKPDTPDPCNEDTSLCNSNYRFPLPLSCTSCYISDEFGVAAGSGEREQDGGWTGVYNEHPTTGWWAADCECSFVPTSATNDSQCTESMIKMVITE